MFVGAIDFIVFCASRSSLEALDQARWLTYMLLCKGAGGQLSLATGPGREEAVQLSRLVKGDVHNALALHYLRDEYVST